MKRSRREGPGYSGAITLGVDLDRSLTAYAVAAAAAGVSALALALPAEGKVVYTPTKTQIVFRDPVPLDLNNDGASEFSFLRFPDSGGSFMILVYKGSNEVWGRGTNHSHTFYSRFASALPAGRKIAADKTYFAKGGGMMSLRCACRSESTSTAGQWLYMKNRYLGLKFFINGEVHYGWARLNGQGKGEVPLLTGYAYETVPNKPIITGKTKGPDVITLDSATLGQLAVGASQLSAWRATHKK